MPAALPRLIGVPAAYLLHQKSGEIGQGSKQGNPNVTLPGEAFQNGREPKRNPVATCGCAEITQRQENDVALRQGLPNSIGADPLFCLLFLLQMAGDPIALVLPEPAGLPRPIREIEERDYSEYDRGNSFQYE